MTPCIPAMRHTGPQSKNHHFFSLSMNADCDKGILTTSESLCCLFHSPGSPPFFAPFVFFFFFFFLSQVNCNHVIKTSTLFSLKLKKKNCGTKSSSVSIKKKEKKIVENACVSPIYRHSLSESQSVAYKGKNAPGAPRTQPGELCWDFPAPEAVNRGPAERDTPGFPPPLLCS